MSYVKISNGIVLVFLAAITLTGCATSAPHAKVTEALSAQKLVRANDQTQIAVQPGAGVFLASYEKDRLAQRIQYSLDAKRTLNPASGHQKNYSVEVTLTKYEKGSAFARAMLAGLGQIHINGVVKVYTLPEHQKAGEFLINKTFAWGGIYGASTTIEDAEMGFADGIANTLTGQEELAQEKKTTKY